jgi:hypothetical protein
MNFVEIAGFVSVLGLIAVLYGLRPKTSTMKLCFKPLAECVVCSTPCEMKKAA